MRLELCFVLVLLFVSIDTCCGLRSTAGLAFRPQSLHVLNFMTASVTDLVLPSPTSTEYKIKEASFSDLGSIVSLRVNVFYPELKSVVSFHTRILDKMRGRHREGSICLIATKKETDDDQLLTRRNTPTSFLNGLSNSLLGAVEFSPSDFKGTPMESIGADRKLYVADLAVRTDARRSGIATQLLLAIELYAFQNHYKEIYLHVEVDNVVARTMYFKNGYAEVPRHDWALVFTESRLHKSVDSYVLLWKSMVGDRDIKMGDSRATSTLDNRVMDPRLEQSVAAVSAVSAAVTAAGAVAVNKISTEVLTTPKAR